MGIDTINDEKTLMEFIKVKKLLISKGIILQEEIDGKTAIRNYDKGIE